MRCELLTGWWIDTGKLTPLLEANRLLLEKQERRTDGRVAIANSDSGGDAWVHFAIEQAAHADALRCPIHVFSRLFAGALRAGQARALGLLEGGSPAMNAASDRLLHGRIPFRSEIETG
ncbi:MAG: hypothetical protein M1457_13005 [bacterium]|nr:hypothetical protein [bacterium]